MQDEKFLIDAYRDMVKIRAFEEMVEELLVSGEIGGTTHLCIGQEACAVAVGRSLRKEDVLFGHHRSDGHFLMKGADPKLFMAELFGKKDGYCQGKGGSIHLADVKNNYMGSSGIVGAQFPIAAGAAYSLVYRNEKTRIVAQTFGDGSTSEGSFHEAMNIAALFELPILFICENNLYSMSRQWNEISLLENVAERVQGYGIPYKTVNGNIFTEAYEAVSSAAELVRSERKPRFIELKTYRFKGHSKSDPVRTYRTLEEEKSWRQSCPIRQLGGFLLEKGAMNDGDIAAIESEAREWVEQAVEFARQCDELPEEAAMDDNLYEKEIVIWARKPTATLSEKLLSRKCAVMKTYLL
jgi:pyruvate dehydrogenase E1 component alpha subunit